MARNRSRITARLGVAALALAAGATLAPGLAAADATDEYPIPSRILKTDCTVDQYMAAARDVEPIYYARYMIDYNNKPVADQDAARERIYWFFSLDYPGRRQYSENIATNAFYESMSWRWPNWAKLFWHNKGVTANAVAACHNYPASDPSVWVWTQSP